MNISDRYDTSGNPEGQYQPGSDGLVLLNKLNIIEPNDIDFIELQLLGQLTESLIGELDSNQLITTGELKKWHHRWLGNVYSWAGEFRTVNMGKGEFQFAAAHLIPKLMLDLETKFLTPLQSNPEMTDAELVNSLAIIHIEFILIHPFREGNGRLSRLLAMIMALQAGRPILDFSWIDANKDQYFSAVQAGLDNPEPMKDVFRQVLLETMKTSV